MRDLIQEMDYEKPIASGSWRYQRDGQATGKVEAWRFTSARDGFHVLRIDLDSNDPSNQELLLFHILLNPDMDIERAKFRYFAAQSEIHGDIQFDKDGFSLNRLMVDRLVKKKERHVEEIMLETDAVFSVPSIAGLSLTASRMRDVRRISIVTLDKKSAFTARYDYADFSYGQEEEWEVLRHTVAVRPCSIKWKEKETTLWLDRYNWPVEIRFSDGQTAADAAYWRYQPITNRSANPA
jgi:hypothetical protein